VKLALYIDSSFLLNIIYSENKFEQYLKYFNSDQNKFSSILLEVESVRSINQFFNLNKKEITKSWLAESEKILEDFISQTSLKNVDYDILIEIKKNKNILELKSLDATHLATASHIRKLISEELVMCTLDERMRVVSNKLDFKLYP